MIQIGIVGCGNISEIYLKNLTRLFCNVRLYACADLQRERAENAAKAWGIEHIMTFEEMLACEKIDLILNLTTPKSHYAINLKSLQAGKHVYVEKPLALTYAQGKELVELAQKKRLYLGGAPDTFMGAGIQTCCKLIDSGFIGRPVAASAFMMNHGHEAWHPAPEFYYDVGGGPLFDMGPYYITALVNLLGEAESVCAIHGRAYEKRTITSQPKAGKTLEVKTDTHTAGIIAFKNGAIATLVTSFDVWKHSMPHMEIYGTLGSMQVPDPNCFDGPVLCSTCEDNTYREIPLVNTYRENSRGIGISDMVLAIEQNQPHNASGALALHVLEIMEALVKSNAQHCRIAIASTLPERIPLNRENPKGVLGRA